MLGHAYVHLCACMHERMCVCVCVCVCVCCVLCARCACLSFVFVCNENWPNKGWNRLFPLVAFWFLFVTTATTRSIHPALLYISLLFPPSRPTALPASHTLLTPTVPLFICCITSHPHHSNLLLYLCYYQVTRIQYPERVTSIWPSWLMSTWLLNWSVFPCMHTQLLNVWIRGHFSGLHYEKPSDRKYEEEEVTQKCKRCPSAFKRWNIFTE